MPAWPNARCRSSTLWVVLLLTALAWILASCGGAHEGLSPIPSNQLDAALDQVDATAKEAEAAVQVPEAGIPDTAIDSPPVQRTATPTFSLPGGTYQGAQSVQLACTTPGASIHYTVDGSVPTDNSPTYLAAIVLKPGTTNTIRAFAQAEGLLDSPIAAATYTIEKASPCVMPAVVISPPGGTYATPQTFTLSCSDSGAEIHYTLDGNDPTKSSPLYSTPFTVSVTTPIKAVAIDPTGECANSPISTATYTLMQQVATPVFSLPSGVYPSSQTVQISVVTPNATVFFTMDGTDPSPASVEYTLPINIYATTTLRAIAVATGMKDSEIAQGNFTISCGCSALSPPTFSPPGGTYCDSQTVTINSPLAGAEIHYTTDGTDPTITSTLYTGPVLVDSSLTLKALAFAQGYAPSAIAGALYTLLACTAAAPPTISPPGGTFSCVPLDVAITTTEPGGVIHYTLDGTVPSLGNGSVYSGPFSLSHTTTVTAVTTATAKAQSDPTVAVFTFNPCDS